MEQLDSIKINKRIIIIIIFLSYLTYKIYFFKIIFSVIYIYLINIIIHEFGHLIFLKIFKYKILNIIIKPFYRIDNYIVFYKKKLIKKDKYKEIIIYLGGIFFNIFFFILNFYLYKNFNFKIIKIYLIIIFFWSFENLNIFKDNDLNKIFKIYKFNLKKLNKRLILIFYYFILLINIILILKS